MKSTGIIRHIDNLGRISIPKELRIAFDLDIHDDVEIFTEDDTLVLKRFYRKCIICGKSGNLYSLGEKTICLKCIRTISEIAKLHEEDE